MILQEPCFTYPKTNILDQESSVDKDGSIIWIPQKKGIKMCNFRGEWTEEEDIYIANFILAQGKRWSTIAR